ncbi:MAG: MurT ligase domain-containing protein [Lachnospiraceae bacterium]|nr:MurT ligase domain-containing protein [Lachnospiraceae bacterium]MDY5741858.1 MurT ligase domain-containing protein [Lachnospiraceae bacterium]
MIRRGLAVTTGRLAAGIAKIRGKQGMTISGHLATKLYPNILRELSSQVREKIIVVCGTNGKTTTTNLIASLLRQKGKKVICNHTGSNMKNGITAAFVNAASTAGRIDADYAVIEIDEASARKVFPQMKPDLMIMTNLFRDQLDRYGEIDTTMNILGQAIAMVPQMRLLINGDDCLLTALSSRYPNPLSTFGVNEKVLEVKNEHEIREGTFCPSCGERLNYELYHYSQIGHYHCDHCGFQRPPIDYGVHAVNLKQGLHFTINEQPISCQYKGFYNIYNIMAAYAALDICGFNLQDMNELLFRFRPENGRNEEFIIRNTRLILNLAKNPAGFNQNILDVLEENREKDVIIAINDREQDGRDISWLWDVDFEYLKDDSIRQIYLTGSRKEDMQLRLKYVDIPAVLAEDMEAQLKTLIEQDTAFVYVLVNYTALYETQAILKKLRKQV